eukprot:6177637-Pleurochrysis_carterae.AAC.1
MAVQGMLRSFQVFDRQSITHLLVGCMIICVMFAWTRVTGDPKLKELRASARRVRVRRKYNLGN